MDSSRRILLHVDGWEWKLTHWWLEWLKFQVGTAWYTQARPYCCERRGSESPVPYRQLHQWNSKEISSASSPLAIVIYIWNQDVQKPRHPGACMRDTRGVRRGILFQQCTGTVWSFNCSWAVKYFPEDFLEWQSKEKIGKGRGVYYSSRKSGGNQTPKRMHISEQDVSRCTGCGSRQLKYSCKTSSASCFGLRISLSTFVLQV